jgi:Rrf2 family protein
MSIKMVILIPFYYCLAETMKLTTKAQYGTRALLDLAIHSAGMPVRLKDIAKRQQIPLPYLGHIITPLVSAGIIRGMRGSRGGVTLARYPEEIRLSEIVQLLDGSFAIVERADNMQNNNSFELHVTQDVWHELNEVMNEFLDSITLLDLIERQKTKEQQEAALYSI